MNAYLNQYQNNMITTASPEQILIMLYDGALRFVRQAEEAMTSGDRVRKLEMISKTLAIVAEFSNSLDHGTGGDIADNLDALYSYMIRELTQANLHDDKQRLDVVEQLLVDLRATWAEAIDVARREAATHAPAARESAQA